VTLPDSPTKPKQLALIDGLSVDTVAVNFSGRIELELSSAGDQQLIEDLMLGRNVKIEVEAYVVGSAGKGPRDKEGDLKAVNKAISLKVHTIDNQTVRVIDTP